MRHALLMTFLATQALADPAEVIDVAATPTGAGWRFDVTLDHGDTGWDDYADGWRVELADGTVIGERPLAHPHVNEMPFTRSQSGIVVPEDVTEVYIRARTNVDGWGDETTPFSMPEG